MLEDVKGKHFQIISDLEQPNIFGNSLPARNMAKCSSTNIQSMMAARERKCGPNSRKAHLRDWRTNSQNYLISLICHCLFSTRDHFGFSSILNWSTELFYSRESGELRHMSSMIPRLGIPECFLDYRATGNINAKKYSYLSTPWLA